MALRNSKEIAAIGLLVFLAAALWFRHKNLPPKQAEEWKVGYWIWAGERPIPSSRRPQVLYVQVQGDQWPRGLPDAESYIIVRRLEPAEELTPQLALQLAQDYQSAAQGAGGHARLDGLQIDYDCPTGRLESYGRFLSRLHGALPPGTHLSITALLDWFGPHTSIRDALASVDEFVPQFYDAGSRRSSSGIAVPIDPGKWAPIFDAQKTPYRIGISSFGRVARRRPDGSGGWTVQYFRDDGPLDFAGRRALKRRVTSTPSGETVVHYEVVVPMPDREDVQPGDVIEITFPTESSVRAAYDAASRFGGYCAGAIFFRWPNRSETLALTFEEVSRILGGGSLSQRMTVEASDGFCIELKCSDLYLHSGRSLASSDRDVQILAEGSIDLFMPGGPLRPMSIGANRILVHVPAFSGTGSIYLGRIVSTTAMKFEVTMP